MRLLRIDNSGELSFTNDLVQNVPPYAILSHTWGADEDEVTFNDLKAGLGKAKSGYTKIEFCAQQAQKDNLQHIWVDTCCIDRANYTELAEAITSMFRWYRDAAECYVYLSDVSTRKHQHDHATPQWESAFRSSRWFTRGWTLQELVAPKSVIFFSREGERLGDKGTLETAIHEITDIPHAALRGTALSSFSTEERMRWAAKRDTKKREDKAYCLFGIFDVFLPLIYGEGDNAFRRLEQAINQSSGDTSSWTEQLLESLNNGNPFTRVNNIPESSEGTFTWIFEDQSSDPDSPEARLAQWLESGDGVFWIVGKPGSGKSTLMKFLVGKDNQGDETQQCLKAWAQPQNPCIVSFYFWLADTSGNQNSFRGFLCHLLYQMLSTRRRGFLESLPSAYRLRQKRRIADWDQQEVQTVLKEVACRVAAETPLCIFIDGLDECISTDIDHVVRLIRDFVLQSESKIKFCLSSRPEQKLANRLEAFAPQKLQLHELTSRDIKRYVTDQFEKCWKTGASPTKEQEANLIREVVWSSEGVFLWAFLVTKKLCEGIEFGDSVDQLQDQLRELPRDMVKLYDNMLGKSDAAKGSRRAEAAMYFQYVLDHGDRRLFHWPIGVSDAVPCSNSGLENMVPFYERFHAKVQPEDQQAILGIMQQRVNFLCAGMVVAADLYGSGTELQFFHRTARDFFCEPSGKEILQECAMTKLESYCLVIDNIFKGGHGGCEFSLHADEVYQMVLWVDEMNAWSVADRVAYLQHIDKSMTQFHDTENGGIDTNWVYDQVKSGWHENSRSLDFVTFTFNAGRTELLSHHLSMGRSLSSRYKDYFLMCTSHRPSFKWTKIFIELGANPNARFYWDVLHPFKTSPWLNYIIESHGGYELAQINWFLDSGACLQDRTIVFQQLGFGKPLSLGLPSGYANDRALVIEVNAKWLLEHFWLRRRISIGSEILSRPDVQKVQSHQRVLLAYPGRLTADISEIPYGPYHCQLAHFLSTTESFPFAEIDVGDSEEILDGVGRIYGAQREGLGQYESVTSLREKVQAIWERSPKVQDHWEYLKEKGYYKDPDDPAVLQGPIPMFEDEE